MRPVDGIDDPARLGVGGPGVALLLAEHGVARVRLGDAFAQQRLGFTVGRRDERAVVLALDGVLGAVVAHRDRVGGVGEGEREGEETGGGRSVHG